MTLTLELTPEVEARLRRKAAREGQDIAAYLLAVADREAQEETAPLPQVTNEAQRVKNQAALDMLSAWDKEDETDDPAEVARREAEWEQFKTGMNAAHSSSGRVIYP